MRIITFILFCTLCHASVANAAYHDKKLGIHFADRIGQFKYINKRTLREKKLGYRMLYKRGRKISISIQIYNFGISNIQTGIGGAHVKNRFHSSQKDIYVIAERGFVRSVHKAKCPIDFSSKFLCASFRIVSNDNVTRRSHLLLRGHNGYFIKIRATGADENATDKAIEDFLLQLENQLGLVHSAQNDLQ